MNAPVRKLVAIGFHRTSRNPLLAPLEEVYSYGVQSQLARFSELNCKDLATVAEKITLDAKLSYDDALQKLQQVCQSTRTHYCFTGTLSPAIGNGAHFNEIKINFRLYEAQGNRYIVDEVTRIAAAPDAEGTQLQFAVPDLNALISQTTTLFLKAIYGDPFPVGNAPFSQSYQAMQLVLEAHRAQEHAEKITLYTQALQADPQLETAYCNLARIYRSEHDYEKAILHYRKALEVSQASRRNRAIYATDAGITCALLGKADVAQQWWLKAIEYDPGYINPYFNIANTLEDQDNHTQAEIYFLKAQQLAPDDFRTYFNLARIYSKTGEWEKALAQYRRQLQTEDGDPWCHSDVATCYLNLGDMQNARQHLEKTVALDPDGEAGEYAKLILSGLG